MYLRNHRIMRVHFLLYIILSPGSHIFYRYSRASQTQTPERSFSFHVSISFSWLFFFHWFTLVVVFSLEVRVILHIPMSSCLCLLMKSCRPPTSLHGVATRLTIKGGFWQLRETNALLSHVLQVDERCIFFPYASIR